MKQEAGRLFIICSLLFSQILVAQLQVPIGSWRVHTSFLRANAVEYIDNKYYVGTDGGLFTFDPEEYAFEKYSTIQGLADIQITALAYDVVGKSLYIGYASGNIDILDFRKKTITNIPYLFEFNTVKDKTIRKMHLQGSELWMLTDLGVIVINTVRKEIKASYFNIGPNAASIIPNDIAFSTDTVYIASANMIRKARYTANLNLMNFQNWQTASLPDSVTTIEAINVNKAGVLYIAAANKWIYSLSGSTWKSVGTFAGVASNMKTCKDSILLTSTNGVYSIFNDRINYLPALSVFGATDIEVSNSGNDIAFSTHYSGLYIYRTYDQPYTAAQNGPATNFAFNIDIIDDEIWVMSGGFDRNTTQNFTNNGFYRFVNDGGYWSTIVPGIFNELPTFNDPVRSVFNPYTKEIYIASAGYGVLLWNMKQQSYSLIDDKSPACPLTNLLPNATFSKYVRVPDIYYDTQTGYLWIVNVVNDINAPSIIRYNPFNKTCETYKLPVEGAKRPIGIITDKSGQVWVRFGFTAGGGMAVIDPDRSTGDLPNFKEFRKGKGNGNLVSDVVNCMALDKDDHLWIGTDYGISVIYNASAALYADNYDAGYPVIDNWPLLFEQGVNCIAVDGGNRKWIGTNNGVYYFSEDGIRVIHYFNTKNSPLLSNRVISIQVHPKTGEVFIGTDKGIISYREGTSQASFSDLNQDIKIFPNPVPSDYTGKIGISNLSENAEVKITDIHGNLVYKTMASGSTAVWDGKDHNGNTIAYGIYVVVAAGRSGQNVQTGKIFLIK